MLRRILLSIALMTMAAASFGQTGSIKGNIKDAITGEVVVGANVMVAGTGQGAVADLDGNFEINKIKAGEYTLIISFISYRTDTLKAITVYPDQATVINTTLTEESQTLSEIVITGTKVTNTDISVITEIKKADLVAVGISAQQISLSQDRDAAQIMRRLPGVTIIGNRFVNVRGLSERYSTVLLNGVIAPSTEVDSKAFSFDLIPSGLIDRMLVFKSGAAEMPGEFAGAVISIYTKNIVEENSFSFSLTTGYRAGTTFQTVTSHEGSGTDWLGYDNGSRKLPASFPSQNLRTLDPQTGDVTLTNATKSFRNNWGTKQQSVAPDMRANLDFTHLWDIGSLKLSNITSVSYSKTNQYIENAEASYYNNQSLEVSNLRFDFRDNRYAEQARIGVISNFTFEISPLHKLEFRNFYNQQGVKFTTTRGGSEMEPTNFDVRNLAMNYSARSIYSGQIQGTHSFTDYVKLTWIGAYSSTEADQPDYRRIRSQRSAGTNDDFAVVIPPTASLLDAGRFFSNMTEKTYTGSVNIDFKLNPSNEENVQAKIMVGGYYESKERDFKARWMSYKWRSTPDLALQYVPFDQIFADENLGTKFILEEGTNEGPNLYDQYKGQSTLFAGYASAVIPFSAKVRLVTGLRLENFHQQLGGYSFGTITPNLVDRTVTDPLPFVNFTYNFTEKMLVRAAYSRTVNRPVFREIAPFQFYDFERNADIFGNPDITTATIDNIDLKWELYPSKAESFSIGVFYKRFQDPIEMFLVGNQNLAYRYDQADEATSYGIEAELRKSLDGLSGSKFISNLDVVFNAALIKSEIHITDTPGNDNQIKDRPLQGQSPYVINAGLMYHDYDRGIQASLMYNVFGKRIFAVGDLTGNRSQYEMPRGLLDFTLTKDIGKHFEFKFGIQDILNQSYRIVQDSNEDGDITDTDDSIAKYKTGQLVSLGIGFRL